MYHLNEGDAPLVAVGFVVSPSPLPCPPTYPPSLPPCIIAGGPGLQESLPKSIQGVPG